MILFARVGAQPRGLALMVHPPYPETARPAQQLGASVGYPARRSEAEPPRGSLAAEGGLREQPRMPPSLYFERVAPNLLVLAVAHFRMGWPTRVRYALTAACLLDLVAEGRIARDDDGLLVVRDRSLTGNRAHTLVLSHMAASGAEWLPSLWVVRLASEAPQALLFDAQHRGVVVRRTARRWGIVSRTAYDVADPAHVAGLGLDLHNVYEGSSTDPRATALLALCAAAALPQLVPSRPRLNALRRRAQQLPSSAVIDGLGYAVGVLAIPAGGG